AGSVSIAGPGSYNVSGTPSVTGGEVDFNLPATSAPYTALFRSLGGSGTYTASATLTWSGGAMAGTGTTQVAAAATLTVTSGVSKELIGRTLTNAGTTVLTSTGELYLENGAHFTNQAGALFDFQS